MLVTGAGGMLGSYLTHFFRDREVKTLGLRKEAHYSVDLRKVVPDFGGERFDTVIHTAGTEEEPDAALLNLEGTKRLLKGLGKNVPDRMVYISSFRVYSRDAGEKIDEEANTWATHIVGQSKAQAEGIVREWCDRNDVTLTIVRPARMFGNGVKGETLQLFNDALSGKYIHIRGNEARISLVTAYDVAKAVEKVYKQGGIYNAADGIDPRFIDMMEAMTANAGAKKRMTHLPDKWAEWIWRIFRWIPIVRRNLSPEVVEERLKTLTLDGRKLAEAAGISYHDTIKVMQHEDETYPYSYKENKQESVHEV